MDTLSATSLDVVRHYAARMEAMSNGKFEEALRSYSKAVELDPKFGLGYRAWRWPRVNLDRLQDAEKYIKEALEHLDGMTERERYRTRGLFYLHHQRLSAVRQGIRRPDRALRGGRVGAQQPRAVLDPAAEHAEGASTRCGRS